MQTEETKVAEAVASPAVLLALMTADQPNLIWCQDDDLCDCTFQRIGQWTNPYIGKTLRVRVCCIWAEIYKSYPQFAQEIPASWNINRHEWDPKPADWDSKDADMPVAIWLRQIAAKTGRPLSEIRTEYSNRLHERPKKVKPATFSLKKQEVRSELALRKHLLASKWLLKIDDPLPTINVG